MRKTISVLLLLFTILISLSFSGFHGSLEGMTNDRVIESTTEEEGVSPAMSPAAATALALEEPVVEGFQQENVHEEYSPMIEESFASKVPSREPTHSVGVFQRIFSMTPKSETFLIQQP